MDSLWSEYKNLTLPELAPISDLSSKRLQEPSPNNFEKASNIADLYSNSKVKDKLEYWISERPFTLKGKTLPVFWLHKLKSRSTYRLAKIALDIASIPAISSNCKRVFSQGKLLITSQQHALKANIIKATQYLQI